MVNLTLDEKGEVTDAVAVSGPQELRKPVIQSVLNWHFSQDSGSTPDLQIAVHFNASQGASPANPIPTPNDPVMDTHRTIASVDLDRLPEPLRDKVVQSGLLQVGNTVSINDVHGALQRSLRNIDDHLRLSFAINGDQMKLSVNVAGQAPAIRAATTSGGNPPASIHVGGDLQATNLLHKVTPLYPPQAKQARIQGTVRFTATIGPDGTMKNLQVVSGDPMLVQAAMEAVKQWVYKPTLLNGNPVEVITTIDVNFTLNQ